MQEDTSVWERDMYKRKIEKDIRCPLEYGLEVFGGNGICGSSVYWLL